jgi:hypothetical protein
MPSNYPAGQENIDDVSNETEQDVNDYQHAYIEE